MRKLSNWRMGIALGALILYFQNPLFGQATRRIEMEPLRAVSGESRDVDLDRRVLSIRSITSIKITPSISFPIRMEFANESGPRRLRLIVPPATPPGEYALDITGRDSDRLTVSATVHVTVEPLLVSAASAGNSVPVILLNGWQVVCSNTESTVAGSRDTFGHLADLLQADGATVFFFNNCSYPHSASIEQLGIELGHFISNNVRNADGTPVSQVDLIAHSMGGLIARAYLSGKSETPGVFAPLTYHKIRKLITIATPHFGSFQALDMGTQSSAMVLGSRFIWDLATWNQGQDDLRGVDALAIIGNAGNWYSPGNADDGVVSLTSASLDFASIGEQRTRIIPYCHTTPGFAVDCPNTALPIAKVSDDSHPTAQIVQSFLAGTTAWQSIGATPDQNAYLQRYGGLVFALKDSNDVYLNDIWSIRYDNGTYELTPSPQDSVSRDIYYSEFISAGQHTFSIDHASGPTITLSASIPAGGSAALLGKSGPIISSVRSTTSTDLPGLTVASGSDIVVTGDAFTTSPQLLANGLPLTISAASDQQITAFLPEANSGLIKLTVTTGSGQHTVNIFAAPVIPPALSVSKIHIGNFTQGQTGASYTVIVTNAASASPTYGMVTVTETVPSGLTLIWMSGSGWNCSSRSCMRSDALSAGSSYPPIMVTVNVASNAPSQVTNQVSVLGGGSVEASATDVTSITESVFPPALSVSKTHIGNFIQGQTGASYTVIVTNAGAADPTSGMVTVTETVPSGLTLISMSGSGWNCASLSCTRSDVLSAGSSYPSITVTVNVASNAPSQVTNLVGVSGGGSAEANATDATIITALPSTRTVPTGTSTGRGIPNQSFSTTEQMSDPRGSNPRQ